MDSPSKALLAVLRIPYQRPLLLCVVQEDHKVCNINDTKNEAHPHSTDQDTQPIAFLIHKQVVPYQTRGGNCCPGLSTPKIWSLADSSTTWHDGINHLHHSNHCSKPNINPHIVDSHLNGWKTCTTLMTTWLSITNQL
jgi:hypothetical protein